MTGANLNGPSTNWQCYALRAAARSSSQVNFQIPADLDTSNLALLVVVWNIAVEFSNTNWQTQAPVDAFYAVTPSASRDRAANVPDGVNIISLSQGGSTSSWQYTDSNLAPGSQTQIVGYYTTIGTPCTGQWRLVVNATSQGADWEAGILYRLVDQSTSGWIGSPISVGTPTTIRDQFFPGLTPISAPINARFAQMRYMIRDLQVSVTGPSNIMNQPTGGPQWSVTLQADTYITVGAASTFGAGTTPSRTYTNLGNGQGRVSLSWDKVQYVDYAPNAGTIGQEQSMHLVIIQPDTTLGGNSNQTGYRWTSPFLDLTLSVDRITEFPSITGQRVTLDSRSTTLDGRSPVYMYITDNPLTYEVWAAANNVQDATAVPLLPLADSAVVMSTFEALPTVAQNRQSSTFITSVVPSYWAAYYVRGSTAGRGAVQNLPESFESASYRRSRVYFFKATLGACGTAIVQFTPVLNQRTVAGECTGHRDCITPLSTHPSQSRAQYSVNGDVSRFDKCYLVREFSGPIMTSITSKCMECGPVPSGGQFVASTSVDCRDGQFCWADEGASNNVLVDTEANLWLGTCRNKSSEALGRRCRAIDLGSGQGQSSTPAVITSPSVASPFSVGATFDGQTAVQNVAPGHGFCGEVRTWNETGSSTVFASPLNTQTSPFTANATARVILWTGACFQGMCYECSPSAGQPNAGDGSGRVCLNGRFVTPLSIDNTPRTLTLNATGSAALASALFLAMILILFAFNMQAEANRHRDFFGEAPMTTRELLHAMFCTCLPCFKTARGERPRIAASGAVRNPLEHAAAEWSAAKPGDDGRSVRHSLTPHSA